MAEEKLGAFNERCTLQAYNEMSRCSRTLFGPGLESNELILEGVACWTL